MFGPSAATDFAFPMPNTTTPRWPPSGTCTAGNAWLILADHEVGVSIGRDAHTTDADVRDADTKAVKDSGLGIVTVAQWAAEVLSQTSGN